MITVEKFRSRMNPPAELDELFCKARSLKITSSAAQLVDIACGGEDSDEMQMGYELPNHKYAPEVNVVRVRSGVSANYVDP